MHVTNEASCDLAGARTEVRSGNTDGERLKQMELASGDRRLSVLSRIIRTSQLAQTAADGLRLNANQLTLQGANKDISVEALE